MVSLFAIYLLRYIRKMTIDIDWQNPDWEKATRDMQAEFDRIEKEQGSVKLQHEKVELCIQFIDARNEMKLTQAQLADKARVTQSMIARLENGKVNTTYQTLARVAEALDRQLILARR